MNLLQRPGQLRPLQRACPGSDAYTHGQRASEGRRGEEGEGGGRGRGREQGGRRAAQRGQSGTVEVITAQIGSLPVAVSVSLVPLLPTPVCSVAMRCVPVTNMPGIFATVWPVAYKTPVSRPPTSM